MAKSTAIIAPGDIKVQTQHEEDQEQMPRVVVHQGQQSSATYGDHPAGTLVDSVTHEVIEARKFCWTMIGWRQWIKWGPNLGDPAEYSIRGTKTEAIAKGAAAADFEFIDGRAPKAHGFYNLIIIFEDALTPICLSLRDSSPYQRKGGRIIDTSAQKALIEGNALMFGMNIVDAKNKKGSWKDIEICHEGLASPDMVTQIKKWNGALHGKFVQVAESEVPF